MERNRDVKKVAIVVGSKGVNATGLIRSLGESGCYVVYASDYSCIESRWTKEYLKLSKNETKRINELVSYIDFLDTKPALYPTDDETSFLLDENYAVLKDKCYLPNASGNLRKLADKINMANMAVKNGLIVPKYKKICLKDSFVWKDSFPVILKPYAGYAGRKGDICICNSLEDYEDAINKLRDKSYEFIMIQQMLCSKERYEVGIMGFSLPDGTVQIPGIIKKIRSYPSEKGSTSYAVYKRVLDCLDYKAIERFVRSTGYVGLFDIEMIVEHDIPYFIEINYRNGQYGYMTTVAGYNLPSNWLDAMSGNCINKPVHIKEIYYMNERDDYLHVKEGRVPFKQWFREFKNTEAYGMYHKNDLRPFIRQYVKIPDRIAIKYNQFRYKLKDLFIREEWNIAIRARCNKLLFEDEGKKEGFIILPNSIRYWAADPFLFNYNGKDYVFFEMYDRFKAKGLIGYRELCGNKYSKMKIAFESVGHLSFPFIFEYENKIYMMPESSNEKCLKILVAVDFPSKWKHEAILIDDKALCDSILFQADRMYLMTQEISKGIPQGVLDLYGFINGEWKKCKDSPIVTGLDKARLAGGIIKQGDDVIRVAQNCLEEYGKKINFHRIKSISDLEYKEEQISEIDVSDVNINKKSKYFGIHTYNMNERYEVIDLKNNGRIRLGNIINIFMRILKKISRK